MPRRPGGEIASRPLHFVWIADCSGSMSANGKIDALNSAIRETIPHMRHVAADNPHARVVVRAAAFSHGARWHVPDPTDLNVFSWADLVADPLPKSTSAADIVFLMDTSGSMGGEIDAVKQSCQLFADEIIRQGAGVRLGLIGFDIGGHRGERRSTHNYTVHTLSQYTIGTWPLAEPSEFKRNIRSLTLGLFGGGGCYLANEDTVDIFPHVVNSFRESGQNSRVLVVISDELGSTDGLGEIVAQLTRAGIVAHVLGVPGKRKAHEELAARSGGQFWSITAAKGDHDFRGLLGSLAQVIAKEVTQKLPDGSTSAGTDMGRAMQLVAEQLRIPPMSDRALPPVLVLISDGHPTDDFDRGLRDLMAVPWGMKAVRIAIAIGEDADLDSLQRFIGSKEIRPLRATNSESLMQYVRWASTVVLKAASSPGTQITAGRSGLSVPIPQPPMTANSVDSDGVW